MLRAASVLGVVHIPIVQLDQELPLPSYAKPGDAGADLLAATDVVIAPRGGRAIVPTGVAIAIPDGYVGLVHPRSGLAAKHGVTTLNSPGTIDSGYRGQVHVVLINTDPTEQFAVKRGERIAQLVVQRVEVAQWDVVDDLDQTERGVGGFGHTGR
ncbi:MAG: dUTP diphosphatase [Actinobacteria bacterium]|nr:dUTP diphosphatase [Actinomycetota bacterium]